jgi:hypothetical protein
MKVDVLSKEETYGIRHFSLVIQVEDNGKIHKLNVDIIENNNIQKNDYNYEVESIGWITKTEGVNVKDLELKLGDYLIDNIDVILS